MVGDVIVIQLLLNFFNLFVVKSMRDRDREEVSSRYNLEYLLYADRKEKTVKIITYIGK